MDKLYKKAKLVINDCKAPAQIPGAEKYIIRYLVTSNFHKAFKIRRIFRDKCKKLMVGELKELSNYYN